MSDGLRDMVGDQLAEMVAGILKQEGVGEITVMDGLVSVSPEANPSVAVTIVPVEGPDGMPTLAIMSCAIANLEVLGEENEEALSKLTFSLNALNAGSHIGMWFWDHKTNLVFVKHVLPLDGMSNKALVSIVRNIGASTDKYDDRVVEFVGSGQVAFDAARSASGADHS